MYEEEYEKDSGMGEDIDQPAAAPHPAPRGKNRTNARGKGSAKVDQDFQVVVASTPDPQIARFDSIIKEEELLSMFIANQRGLNKAKDEIIKDWQVKKATINESNIDLYLREERLKFLVAQNRAQIGYDKHDILKMIQMAVEKAKG